jgi:DNA primase
MAKIPREVVDAVRERTDIAEVISRHVALIRKGRSIVGLCPFHQEKTPSFHVIPDKGIYHCFGCQAGGDVFKFLMMLEGLSFVEAVKELATAVGIEIAERDLSPAEHRALKQRATAFDVLEAAAGFYEAQLWTGAGAAPRKYLEQRALSVEYARKARLGWAPGGWTRLVDHLHREGFDAAQVADAGVARPRNQGEGFYDTLRERLVIPIRDERGRVVAFGGRLLEGEGPKYLNTPETPLYQKSHTLYGLDIARTAIGQRGRVIVVEGYFDVLGLQQAGFPESVATCGTALTPHHLEKIRRLARDVVLVMDADEAGLRAAERSLPLFVEAGIQPWRLELPGAKDPDELVRVEGPEAFAAALEQKEPLLEWVIGRNLTSYGVSAMSKERLLEELLPMLHRLRHLFVVPDPDLVPLVARALRIKEDIVIDRLRLLRRQIAAEAAAARNASRGSGEAEKAEESQEPPPPRGWQPQRDMVHILWLLVHRYGDVADLIARVDPALFNEHEPVRPVIARLLSGEPLAALLPEVTDPGVQKTLLAVVARPKLYEPEETGRAVLDLLSTMAKPVRAARLAAISTEIQKAEAAGDLPRLRTAMQRKKATMDQERALKAAKSAGKVEEWLALMAEGEPAVPPAPAAKPEPAPKPPIPFPTRRPGTEQD